MAALPRSRTGAHPWGRSRCFAHEKRGIFSDEELEALRQLARHLSLRLYGILAQSTAQQACENPLEALISELEVLPREAEVLKMMLAGKTNREMAEELYISESTVKKHVNALYHKLGVKNRLGLMALVREQS